jgi:hypothetical protein
LDLDPESNLAKEFFPGDDGGLDIDELDENDLFDLLSGKKV